MYTFIYTRDEIVILIRDIIDFTKVNLNIYNNDKQFEILEIITLREFLNDEWYNRYTIKLTQKLDISKKYTLKLDEVTYEVDYKQYFKTNEFKKIYSYTGNDLGVSLFEDETVFKIWSPVASKVTVKLYVDDKTDIYDWYDLEKGEKGVFFYRHPQNLKNMFYNFELEVFGHKNEVVDVYSKSLSFNGKRSFIVDLEETNPLDFRNHYFSNGDNSTECVVYKTDIRDLTMHVSSGIQNKRKYFGLTESNTKNNFGQSTGIDHIVELGATHIQLQGLLVNCDSSNYQYTLGYELLNNASFSTNPYGVAQINELKTAIMSIHNANLGVILDMNFNNPNNINTNFEKSVPGYYYRCDSLGNYYECEFATERFMVRKYIIDTVVYCVKEYKVDGFRFDLMGLIDVKTMNSVRSSLDNVNPDIFIFGEGWTGCESILSDVQQSTKENAFKSSTRIAYFSDDIRDGIKGDDFENELSGFVNGSITSLDDIKFGVVGGIEHKGIDIDKVSKSKDFWADEPTQVVSYVSPSDNWTLYDKLSVTSKSVTEEEIIKMNKLAAFILSISQGAIYIQSGEEFGRSKLVANSEQDDSLDWNQKHKNKELYNYYKGLIKLRKSDDVFTLTSAKDIKKRVNFGECSSQFLVVKFKPLNSKYKRYLALINASSSEVNYQFEDEGMYRLLVDGEYSGTEMLNFIENCTTVPPKTAMFYAQESEIAKKISYTKKHKKSIGVVAGTLTAVIAVTRIIKKYNK